MKANTHPQYFEQAQVICVCGNRFTTGSTVEVIHVELCNNCHPFYTGEQRFLDRASLIDRFEKKRKVQPYVSKKARKAEKEKQKTSDQPKTLREMLLEVSK